MDNGFLLIMIAGIDSQADIELYLEPKELERLANETVEGVLVKTSRPKRQGTINISINDSRKNENGIGIGIDDSRYWGVADDFHVSVFMGSEWYRELMERGVIGTRQRMRDGSKIHIYDRSQLDGIDFSASETLEFYRDNKEELTDHFG